MTVDTQAMRCRLNKVRGDLELVRVEAGALRALLDELDELRKVVAGLDDLQHTAEQLLFRGRQLAAEQERLNKQLDALAEEP